MDFLLLDEEGDLAGSVALEYSETGSGGWAPAALHATSPQSLGLEGSPEGTPHQLIRDLGATPFVSQSARLRLRVLNEVRSSVAGFVQQGQAAVVSDPFKVGPLDIDSDGHLAPTDCDDTTPLRFPGYPELCDGLDNDCDLLVPLDEGDLDGDTWAPCAGDCDDTLATTAPGAAEACDDIDSDCDLSFVDGEPDFDADLWPDCVDLDDDGDVEPDTSDCAPFDAAIHPAAVESCDLVDSDCDLSFVDQFPDLDGDLSPNCTDLDDDGDLDPDSADCAPLDLAIHHGAPDPADDGIDGDCSGADSVTCFEDGDGDSFGGPSTLVAGDGDCFDAGESLNSFDCDDSTALIAPGQTEACDAVDSDCDTDLVEGAADLDGDDLPDCVDDDLDGDGSPALLDCDDTDDSIFPGAPEVEDDGVDSDCSGTDSVTCFVDGDGDGFGGQQGQVEVDGSCVGGGLSADASDCDDSTALVAPGEPESCDAIDSDCDGDFVEGAPDTDGDLEPDCVDDDDDGDGSEDAVDCDDTHDTAFPGGIEEGDPACTDGFDNDCDETIDTLDKGCQPPGDDDSGDDDSGDDDSGDDDSGDDDSGDDDSTPGDDDSTPTDDDTSDDDSTEPTPEPTAAPGNDRQITVGPGCLLDHAGVWRSRLPPTFALLLAAAFRRRRPSGPRQLGALYTLLACALLLTPTPARAERADELSIAASELFRDHCSDASRGDSAKAYEAQDRIWPTLKEIHTLIDAGGPTYLRFWRAQLGQCIGRAELAEADYAAVIESLGRNPTFDSMIKDARRNLDRLRRARGQGASKKRGTTAPASNRTRITPRTATPDAGGAPWDSLPRLSFAFGAGWSAAVPHHYALFAADLQVRLGGTPLHFALHVAPAVGSPPRDDEGAIVAIDGRVRRPVLTSFGPGLVLRGSFGPVEPEIGLRLDLAANPAANLDPSLGLTVKDNGPAFLAGPIVRGGIGLRLGPSPLRLRILGEGGALVPQPAFRALVMLGVGVP